MPAAIESGTDDLHWPALGMVRHFRDSALKLGEARQLLAASPAGRLQLAQIDAMVALPAQINLRVARRLLDRGQRDGKCSLARQFVWLNQSSARCRLAREVASLLGARRPKGIGEIEPANWTSHEYKLAH